MNRVIFRVRTFQPGPLNPLVAVLWHLRQKAIGLDMVDLNRGYEEGCQGR
jgi:hypothetical protein